MNDANPLHDPANPAGSKSRATDADAYHLDQAFPLLMKQRKRSHTTPEKKPNKHHTTTSYTKARTPKTQNRSRTADSYRPK
ncbi:type IV toxin-antitoxin system YeeU family antitoxin [Escherichia coli]|uniref:type IV toxin-antitoxin system YeeU family antitoxin n=1 Tax=Escherichia coli TaxID=562 RepID=UPI0006523235